jgi:hypothetical protein
LGTISTQINKIISTYDGGYLLAGNFGDSLPPYNKLFIVKIDANGQGNCNHTTFSLDLSHQNFVFTNPVFSSFNFTPDILPSSSIVSSDDSLIDVNQLCQPTGIESVPLTNNKLSVIPNPSSGTFTLTYPSFIRKGTVEIYSLPGNRVYQSSILNETETAIDLKNVSPGMYIIKLFDGKSTFSDKLIIKNY